MDRMGFIQKRIPSRWNVPASSDAYSNRETISYFLILVQTNKKAYAHSRTDVWKKVIWNFSIYFVSGIFCMYMLENWFLFYFTEPNDLPSLQLILRQKGTNLMKICQFLLSAPTFFMSLPLKKSFKRKHIDYFFIF